MAEKYDLIVVGGGASGMMAAGRAADRGLRVLLLEKNARLGEKLRISGGGRCNILNAEEDPRVLLKKYGKAEQFLYAPFAQFGVIETRAFFETRGLPLKIEAGKRAFPHTEKAEDVVRVLEAYMKKGGVVVQTRTPVSEVFVEGDMVTGVRSGTVTYHAKEYLFASGGVSHPETGSTGDGFEWLTKLGHTVAKPTPTIVPLKVRDHWIKVLAGTTLPDIKITFFVNGTKAFVKKGNILCTHFGLSGPLILNCAHQVADLLHDGVVTGAIDLFPLVDHGTLERQILNLFEGGKNKVLKNVVRDFVPLGTQKGVLTLLAERMDIETKVHSVSKEDRKQFVQLLKALPLSIEGLMGFNRAVVADGGVPLGEIDMKTMRSQKIKNILVTGDLLHINRPSGGYSLQLCWTTGYIAGSCCGSVLK